MLVEAGGDGGCSPGNWGSSNPPVGFTSLVPTRRRASGVRRRVAKQVHQLLRAPPPGLLVGRVGQSVTENAELCLSRELEMGEAAALGKQISAPVREI